MHKRFGYLKNGEKPTTQVYRQDIGVLEALCTRVSDEDRFLVDRWIKSLEGWVHSESTPSNDP
jgi:hypothetical protein